ncbi:SpaA isopeptide-forming pilin-related protein [Faecalibaculum rodentium]|jgi:LPXTG-motif cell wall-anchored protein|uniref:SpaA isopeptide-forming pilin-related protein n=1 Tax=Faecalibaculum rodentium TaxID=1702221 RepID=UPI0024936174|nr:SpaA isopeptide-forming pilin-related protein [Faecalibaculum rodentium]
MKHTFKKLFSILAAFMMVVGLGLTTVKAAGNASITITNADAEATYELWKVFDAELTNGNDGIAYYTAEANADAVTNSNVFETVGTAFNGKIQVKAKADATGTEIAEWLKTNNNLSNIGATQITTEPTKDNKGTVTWNGLDFGYYFIKSTLGTDVAVTLTSTQPNATVQAKNTNSPEVPKDAKKVVNSEGTVISDPSVKIGDSVKFQISFTARNHETDDQGKAVEVTQYVVEDTPSGLSIKADSVTVTVGSTPVAVTPVIDNNGKMTITLPWKEGNDFKYPSPSKVVITYEATLNALTGTNKANVQFNNKTKPIDVVTVDTTAFTVKKIAEDKTTELTGASFELYADANMAQLIKLTKKQDGTYVVDPEAINSAVIEAGTATVDGLKTNTTYYLKEVKAPAGYNLKTEVTPVTTGDKSATIEVKVVNQKGGTLPSTGGMGTTMLYTAGGLLVVGAAVVLAAKKRMNA